MENCLTNLKDEYFVEFIKSVLPNVKFKKTGLLKNKIDYRYLVKNNKQSQFVCFYKKEVVLFEFTNSSCYLCRIGKDKYSLKKPWSNFLARKLKLYHIYDVDEVRQKHEQETREQIILKEQFNDETYFPDKYIK